MLKKLRELGAQLGAKITGSDRAPGIGMLEYIASLSDHQKGEIVELLEDQNTREAVIRALYRVAALGAKATEEERIAALGGSRKALLGLTRAKAALTIAGYDELVRHPESILKGPEAFEAGLKNEKYAQAYGKLSYIFLLLAGDLGDYFGYDSKRLEKCLKEVYQALHSQAPSDADWQEIKHAGNQQRGEKIRSVFFGVTPNTPWQAVQRAFEILSKAANEREEFIKVDIRNISRNLQLIQGKLANDGLNTVPGARGTDARRDYILAALGITDPTKIPKILEPINDSKVWREKLETIQSTGKTSALVSNLNKIITKTGSIKNFQVTGVNYEHLRETCKTKGISEKELQSAIEATLKGGEDDGGAGDEEANRRAEEERRRQAEEARRKAEEGRSKTGAFREEAKTLSKTISEEIYRNKAFLSPLAVKSQIEDPSKTTCKTETRNQAILLFGIALETEKRLCEILGLKAENLMTLDDAGALNNALKKQRKEYIAREHEDRFTKPSDKAEQREKVLKFENALDLLRDLYDSPSIQHSVVIAERIRQNNAPLFS